MGLLDDAIREHLDLKRARGADPAEIERMERDALGPVRREPTFGSAPFDGAQEREAPRYAPEQQEEHLTELEQLQEFGYHDSTAPHPHPHDHYSEHEAASHLDFADEHAPHEEPLTAAESSPQRRRFLRRSRPASLSEDALPEPAATAHPASDYHDEFELDAELEHHKALGHSEVLEHGPPEHPEPGPVTPPGSAEPPSLQFEHPPKRPRFSAEPPALQETAEDEPEPPEPAASELAPAAEPSESQETTEFDVQKHLADGQHHEEDESEDDDMLEETPEFLLDTPEHDRLWFEQRPPRDFDFDG